MATRLESLKDGFAQAHENTLTIEVLADPADIREEWIAVAARAAVSPYQSYSFASGWANTIGRVEAVRPFIVVARDAAGRATAILPLCVQRRAGLKIALFLGGR